MRNLSQRSLVVNHNKSAYNERMNTILLVFSLVSVLRHVAQSARRIRGLISQNPLKISFWLALCRQARLINSGNHPTSTFYQWLEWSGDQQIRHLLEAWLTAPRNLKNRQLRARLLRRLQNHQPTRPSDQRELSALNALGIWDGQTLTPWGEIILGLRPALMPAAPAGWQVQGNILQVHPPLDWKLLWQLEAFVLPTGPFTYNLEKNRACQPGQAEKLVEILETGLRAPLPGDLRARLLGQPSLRTSTGLVLEFSDPAQLRQIRRSPTLRGHCERILSPRHILVDSQTAPRLLKLLERRGMYTFSPPQIHPASSDEFGEGSGVGRTHFPRRSLLQPLGPTQPLTGFIQQSIRQQTTFEMFYHAPNGERPELHRITPLLIEERGGYTYIIAYSHTRRGQRTCRLDRMDVPGTT